MIPGFVDLQVNGYGGVDFSDAAVAPEQFAAACRGVLSRGTVAFLPTLITSSDATYRRNLPLLAELMESPEFRDRLLGFHIEGPFISKEPGAVGAHDPAAAAAPDPDRFDRLQEWARGRIKLLTLAAELPGAERLCRHAVKRGVVVSLGHQLADGASLRRLADAGAAALTHLGNGIPNLLPRHPNPIWEGLAEERLSAMLIADGHHLPLEVVKVMIRAKGVERCVAVSDASCMAGMPPGEYQGMGNRIRLEENGRLWNPDKNCLVGSSAMLLDCINFLRNAGFLTHDELLRLGFHNPLALLGLRPEALRLPQCLDYSEEVGFFAAN